MSSGTQSLVSQVIQCTVYSSTVKVDQSHLSRFPVVFFVLPVTDSTKLYSVASFVGLLGCRPSAATATSVQH